VRRLHSVRQVIDELGGNTAVAKMLGYSSHRVAMWLSKGNFPSNTYIVFKIALSRRKASAPDSLWRMVERTKE
jgi:hypothetical protein